jgi:CubicO group peptidase (beta-lactamase class C family)
MRVSEVFEPQFQYRSFFSWDTDASRNPALGIAAAVSGKVFGHTFSKEKYSLLLMKSCLLNTCIILFLFSTSYAQQPSEFNKVDSIVSRHMTINHIPGLALAIIKNGKIEKKGFYGTSDIEANTKVDDNTIFEIASMTKQITCAGILLLQEDGMLSVKDKLSKYLPNLPSLWKEITIEQLMNHTSGLRDDWDEPTSYFLTNNSNEKMSSAQQKYPLLFEPGKGFQYSSGPFFLGLVIEKIIGTHYSFFLKQRIFDKLKMLNTNVYDSTSFTKHLAKGYNWNNDKYEAGIDIPAAAESRADVGLITTLDDMIKWSLALNDTCLLNSQSLKFMFSSGNLIMGNSIPYGCGWYIYFFRNQLIYEHGGAFRTGFNSRISKFPNSKVEIIILSNKWKAKLSDLTYNLATLYDSDFKRITELKHTNSGTNKRDFEIRELLYDLSIKKFNSGQLYRNVNISGFDPNELKELLKGFKEIECIGTKFYTSKTLELYGSKVTEILYYKISADNTTYWSFAYDNRGKLVFVNMED